MNDSNKSAITHGESLRSSRNLQSTIADPLSELAGAMPEALAVIAPGRTLTFGNLDRLVTATAQRLQTQVGGEGARAGLYLPNGWQVLVLVLASIRAGVVVCPISTRMPPKGVAALLRTVSASLLITGRSDLAGHLPDDIVVMPPEEVVEEEGGGQEAASHLALDQPATVVFTSGSMGSSKAALHSVGNHYFSAKGSNANIELAAGDRWLLALPLYHVGGLGIVFRGVLMGATVVVPGPGLALGAAVRRYGITHVSLVGTQLGRMLREEEGAAPAGLKAVLVGGSAVPVSLVRDAHARGFPIHITYGLTEMTSQVTTTPPGASLDRLGTAGRLLPYRQIRIAEDGEILVRGAVLFQGYVDGEALHRPLDTGGWFHSGDRGTLDADGFLRVLGRVDNMFISGGENIHPEEIEQVLCTLDGVQQAVVVPVADASFGQRPIAFVKMIGSLPAHEVFAVRLEALLARFKIPLAFYAWPGEAASPGMKIDRAFFRRYAEQMHRAEW